MDERVPSATIDRMRATIRHRLLLIVFSALCSGLSPVGAAPMPESKYRVIRGDPVTVRYVPSRKSTAEEVARIAPESVQRIAGELGMTSARGPIRIDLPAPGEERWYDGHLPDWVAGFAQPSTGTVVLVWGREPTYPYRTNQILLEHELTHILLNRALLGKPIPRWFNEGVAMYISREWVMLDSWHTLVGMLSHGDLRLARVSGMFRESGGHARTAYALSYSFIRYLVEKQGPEVIPAIVRKVASGQEFHTAFRNVTGMALFEAEREWRRRSEIRYRWIPVATSTTTLWLVITTLVLVVYMKKRKKSQKTLQEWEEEEAFWSDESGPVM